MDGVPILYLYPRQMSNIIYSLPLNIDTKKKLFELSVKVLKGTVNLNTVIDELSKLRIVLDDPIEQSSHEMILDAQRNLNSFLDNLWNVIDLDNIEDLNEIILSIRNIFNSLFQLIQEQQKQQKKLSEDIIKLNQDVAMLKMSEVELLLGAMGTQLIIKCTQYLKINEPLHITKFRTIGMLNTNENIAVLKDFLKDNGYDWNYLSIIIQMLK
jgi:hypothetical protein